jgi:hypothetical protein
MTKKDKTPKTPKPARDPNAPAVKRPRAGCWTPVTRQIPIPGSQDADGKALTLDAEMYSVEFAGETIEVLKNRDGVKRANAWIKGIKNRGEESLHIDKISRQLEALSESASSQEMTARLYKAAQVLKGERVEGGA